MCWSHPHPGRRPELKEQLVILIVLKVQIRPDRRDDWLANIQRYTDAVRQEQGNLSFECSESIETPNEFVVVEGFQSREVGNVHTQTDHFKDFMVWFPEMITAAPKIVNVEIPGWSEMTELR
jgi:quinol monooxygenase YgiN